MNKNYNRAVLWFDIFMSIFCLFYAGFDVYKSHFILGGCSLLCYTYWITSIVGRIGGEAYVKGYLDAKKEVYNED